jgi:hypothetical protein
VLVGAFKLSPHTQRPTSNFTAHTGGPSRSASVCSPCPSQFKFGKRHGEGVMKYRAGQVLARYEGLWEFDVPEGLGKFEYSQDSKVSLVAQVKALPCPHEALRPLARKLPWFDVLPAAVCKQKCIPFKLCNPHIVFIQQIVELVSAAALVQVVEGTFKDGFLNGPGRVAVMNLDSTTGEAPKLTVSKVCGVAP